MEDGDMTVAQCAKQMGCCSKIILKHIDLGHLVAQNLTPWSRKRTIKIRRTEFEKFRQRLPSAAKISLAKPLEEKKKTNQKGEKNGTSSSSFLTKYESRRGRWHEEV